MAAYLIAEHEIHDAERFEAYRSAVAPMMARYGGRYVSKPGSHEVLDGAWRPTRVVIVEFPDMATLKRWYQSPDYAPLIELRRSSATDVLIALEGA